MVGLFDIQAGKVIVSKSALAIPCFRSIWDGSEDKIMADKYISYIVLNNHPDSPYMSLLSADRKKRISQKLFGEDDWKPTEEVLAAEIEYVELLDTLALKMLRSSRNKLESMIIFLGKMDDSNMDLKMIKDMLDIVPKMEKAIKSISILEKQVRKDELESSRIKGGSEVGHYEIPRK